MVGNKSSDKKTQDWRLHETEMCSQSKFDLNVYLELSILSLMYSVFYNVTIWKHFILFYQFLRSCGIGSRNVIYGFAPSYAGNKSRLENPFAYQEHKNSSL